MFYQIIQDKPELEKFVNWLDESNENGRYYVALFARKKYNPIIPSDKECIKRFICHKKDLVEKIEQLEIKLDLYKIKDLIVPNDALALYISTNLKNLRNASYNSITEMLRKLKDGEIPNPKSIALNELQKSSHKKYVTFDFDNKQLFEENIENIRNILGYNECNYIETHGGYHLIVNPDLCTNKYWYPQLIKLGIDQRGDNLLSPIPGTTQGSFCPRFF